MGSIPFPSPHTVQKGCCSPNTVGNEGGGGGEGWDRWAVAMQCNGTCIRVSEVSRPSRQVLSGMQDMRRQATRSVSAGPPHPAAPHKPNRILGFLYCPPSHYGLPPSLHTLCAHLCPSPAKLFGIDKDQLLCFFLFSVSGFLPISSLASLLSIGVHPMWACPQRSLWKMPRHSVVIATRAPTPSLMCKLSLYSPPLSREKRRSTGHEYRTSCFVP